MSYTAKSFEKCLFNPMDLSPELDELRPDCEHSENVLKYILCLYDPKSPLIKDNKNITQRKQEAARLAGFDLEKDSEFLDGLYTFSNKAAVESTCLFLRKYVNEMLWSTIVVHEQMYYEYHSRLMASIEEVDTNQKDVYSTVVLKEKLREGLIAIYRDLQAFYKEMYPEEALREAVTGRKITPETMSRV